MTGVIGDNNVCSLGHGAAYGPWLNEIVSAVTRLPLGLNEAVNGRPCRFGSVPARSALVKTLPLRF